MTKLFVWHISETFEFILIPHGVNYKLGKLHGQVLHFFPKSMFVID